MFFGNLFVYFQFQGKTHIDEHTRTLVFSVLIAVGILGFFFLTALRPIEDNRVVHANDIEADDELEQPSNGVTMAFKNSINLFFTKEMLLLSLTFFYTGEVPHSNKLCPLASLMGGVRRNIDLDRKHLIAFEKANGCVLRIYINCNYLYKSIFIGKTQWGKISLKKFGHLKVSGTKKENCVNP